MREARRRRAGGGEMESTIALGKYTERRGADAEQDEEAKMKVSLLERAFTVIFFFCVGLFLELTVITFGRTAGRRIKDAYKLCTFGSAVACF